MMSSRAIIAATAHVKSLRLVTRGQQRQQFLLTVSSQQPLLRSYSTTFACLKKRKDDDDDDDEIITMNTEMSEEEARQLIDDELAKMEKEHADKFAVAPEDWKPGMRKRKLVVGRNLEDFEREIFPDRFAAKWTLRDKRCGALAIKVGMLPVWDPVWGERHACTLLYVDNNVVLGHKTMEQNGYTAVQVAAGQRKRKNVGKSILGQYKGLLQYDPTENPPFLVREFRVTNEEHMPPLFSCIHARHFVPGQNVDISGISKGKGFQGAMKRWGFGGMPATHGTSKSHRHLGSTGACQDPGKVWKGKKMAGRMGGDRVTVQNMRVLKIDRGRNLLWIKGHVPGQKGGFVEIRDAVKKPLWNTDLVEGALDRPPLPTYEYANDTLEGTDDEIIDGSGAAGHELFMPIGNEDPFDPDYRHTVEQLPADD
ncbi:protein L3 [Seminavis robusta]|uniref:Large ribosomal subunit protein uL3m n=1 Tax=Seminavis robusta TaxID=568900 RepID=A0A9N8H9N1_9STRA|nr:protein L3 [Seminavis robusta]|eukprot:Sro261_g101740.1 protein L3 (424) ;mRNA; f:38083-39455